MRGKAIVLVSGGLDSATALAWAIDEKYDCLPISFFYGQRHARETMYAAKLCEHFDLPLPRNINLAQAFAVIGGSSLTSGLVSGNPSTEQVERTTSDLPPSFVPGRNLIMLSIAAAIGYTTKAYTIVGGWNAVDYSGYPDCREDFLGDFVTAANRAFGFSYEGREPQVKVECPLVEMTKAQIIQLGNDLKVPYGLTWSCYAGGDVPCMQCDSCKIREEGFRSLGMIDPLLAEL